MDWVVVDWWMGGIGGCDVDGLVDMWLQYGWLIGGRIRGCGEWVDGMGGCGGLDWWIGGG